MGTRTDWEEVHKVEDALAVLASVEKRRQVIQVQAWRGGDWEQVFREAVAMEKELAKVRRFLSQSWQTMVAVIHG